MTASLTPLVSALGIAQIISWGSLFYAIGVLGPAMRAELGVSELFLFGAFTAGLLVSGTLAPAAGRAIDRRGGRFVLSVGSLLAIIAMALLAVAPNPSAVPFSTAPPTISSNTSALRRSRISRARVRSTR